MSVWVQISLRVGTVHIHARGGSDLCKNNTRSYTGKKHFSVPIVFTPAFAGSDPVVEGDLSWYVFGHRFDVILVVPSPVVYLAFAVAFVLDGLEGFRGKSRDPDNYFVHDVLAHEIRIAGAFVSLYSWRVGIDEHNVAVRPCAEGLLFPAMEWQSNTRE